MKDTHTHYHLIVLTLVVGEVKKLLLLWKQSASSNLNGSFHLQLMLLMFHVYFFKGIVSLFHKLRC